MPPAAPPQSRYRKLPGRPPSFRLASTGASVLWMGDEHLMQVDTVYYAESYKVFAYGDMQAFLLRETSRGLIYSSVLGIMMAAFGLIAWSVENPGGRGFLLGCGAVLLVLLLVNLLRGKTCFCHLQTASGTHPLRSLSRVRPARKALRLLTEKVESVQGAPIAGS